MSTSEIIKRPIENIGDTIKKSAWTSIIESILTLVLGILLIAWPDTVVKVVAYIVGIFLVVKGVYGVINYFVVKGHKDFFNDGLLWGVISVLAGAAVLILGSEIANVFRIVVGIWIVYGALVKMNTSIKLNAAGIKSWKYLLILAIMMLVVGVFVTFYQGAAVILIGWMMVLGGLIGVVGDVMFMQQVDKMVKFLTGKDKKENA